jgi:hypothetical protein
MTKPFVFSNKSYPKPNPSAEQQAIITALENTTQTSKPTAISTDSLIRQHLETDGPGTRKQGISGN